MGHISWFAIFHINFFKCFKEREHLFVCEEDDTAVLILVHAFKTRIYIKPETHKWLIQPLISFWLNPTLSRPVTI